jgi:hypothetical protein
MDTLTRIRAFHRCCRSGRLFRCGSEGRPLQGVAVQICPRTGRRSGRAAAQPYNPAILAHRSRAYLLPHRLRHPQGNRQPRRSGPRGIKDLKGRIGLRSSYLRGRSRRPVADRLCRRPSGCTLESFPTTALSILSRRAMMWPSASPGLRIRDLSPASSPHFHLIACASPEFSRNTARLPTLRSFPASPALSTPMAVSQQLAV